MSSINRKIAVTGLGPISSIGIGKNQLWQSIVDGRTELSRESYLFHEEMIDSYYIHKIKQFDIDQFGIRKDVLEDIKSWKGHENATDLYYLMAAVKLALDDSSMQVNDIGKRVGLVLFHENPGLDQFYEDIISEFHKHYEESQSKSDFFNKICKNFMKRGYDLQTFMFLFQIAKAFDIHGYSLFLNNACSSGLYAIEAAADIIKSGKCDAVIVAGADCGSIYKYLWFKELEMYPNDGRIKPFAENRDGFVISDGGAGIVLEDMDFALERKAHIYAEYLGGGFSLEGWKVAMPDMTGDSYKSAILDAANNSRIKKEEIDFIVPHGVGTKVSDAYEAKALTDIYGKNFLKPLISAFKPYLGHNLGDSALLETIVVLMSLENNMIPPTLNCLKPDSSLGIKPVSSLIQQDLNIVMKTACAFAGFNSACIFKKIKEMN